MRTVYSQTMSEVAGYLGDQHLKVNGDGRFDSPGHCALYGTYTIMDSDSSLVISSQLVKVWFHGNLQDTFTYTLTTFIYRHIRVDIC